MKLFFGVIIITALFGCSSSRKGVKLNDITWAKSNVGATKLDDIGSYYTWDEAQCACPKGWRLPTQSELASLAKLGSEWTTLNNKNGRKFGSGKEILFLPAGGFRSKNKLISVDKIGYYWSSTPFDMFSYCLNFDSRIIFPLDYYNRDGGLLVRCVKK